MGDLAHYLAQNYLKTYGGHVSKETLFNDFLIVAVASLKSLDLVCTQDTKTMASEHAQKAYFAINKKNGLRTPEFILLEDFKKKI